MRRLWRWFFPATTTRDEVVSRLAVLVVPLVMIAGVSVCVGFGVAVWLSTSIPVSIGIGVLIWLMGRTVDARQRAFERLRARNFRICPNCTYDLGSNDPQGACPECGARYSPAVLREGWMRIYGHLTPPDRPASR